MKWDDYASASAEVGIIFTALALITGAMFSNESWGAYWNWDPRQTTTLILFFLYAGYLSLRSAIENEESRARISAVLGIFGYAGVPLTYFSTRIWFSLHPKTIGLDPLMRTIVILMMISFFVLYAYILLFSVRLKRIEREYKKLSGGW